MASSSPPPISARDLRARLNRITRLVREMGFEGQIEYRHVYSRSGGALYGQGSTAGEDLLTVYVEAFERDADPEDFSFKAMLAHERGHQILVRHLRIARMVAGRISRASEEILASLLGALICEESRDRETLVDKAAVELIGYGVSVESVERQILDLLEQLEALL